MPFSWLYLLYVVHVVVRVTQGNIATSCASSPENAVILTSNRTTQELNFKPNCHSCKYGVTCYWLLVTNDVCYQRIQLRVGIGGIVDRRTKIGVYDVRPTKRPKDLFMGDLRTDQMIESRGEFLRISATIYNRGTVLTFQFNSVQTDKETVPSTGTTGSTNEHCTEQSNHILTSTYGRNYITSANFGHHRHYSSSLRCGWMVYTDDPCYAVVQISLLNISLEDGYDFLRVYDGPSNKYPLLAAFTGNELPEPIMSSGSKVFLSFTTDNKNTDRGFRLAYENTNAVPLILDGVTQHIEDGVVNITVPFLTSTVTIVHWLKEGDIVYTDRAVYTNISEEDCTIHHKVNAVHYSTYSTVVSNETFGQYKVSIRNKYGFAERFVELRKPGAVAKFGNHSILKETDRIRIRVYFHSVPRYTSVKWYKWNRRLNVSRKKYKAVVTSYNHSSTVQYLSELTILSPTVRDYKSYQLHVQNSRGVSKITIYVPMPISFIPESLGHKTKIGKTATIAVYYKSKTGVHDVKWYRESAILTESKKYHIEFNTTVSTLEILSPKRSDFTTYTASISNAAGSRVQYVEVKEPTVFPAYVNCTQGNGLSITCIIDTCRGKFLPWIHSINGEELRRPHGHVEGNASTLKISHCTGDDLGDYTCVEERIDNNGSKREIHRDSVYIETLAPPILGEELVTKDGNITLSVDIYSNPPLRYRRWFKESKQLINYGNVSISLEESQVQVQIRGKTMILPGFKFQLLVKNITDVDFGRYRVAVANIIGFADSIIEVDNPLERSPSVSNKSKLVFKNNVATLEVAFHSFPKYELVEWLHVSTGISIGNFSRHTLSTTNGSKPHRFISKVVITDMQNSDLGDYELTVFNRKGAGHAIVTLRNPQKGPPVIHGEKTDVYLNKTAFLYVNFTCSSLDCSVIWHKTGVQVKNTDKYSVITQPQLIKQSKDPDLVMEGFQSMLSVRNVGHTDFGIYEVELRNALGFVIKDILLDNGCQFDL